MRNRRGQSVTEYLLVLVWLFVFAGFWKIPERLKQAMNHRLEASYELLRRPVP
ncbi:MAG TPA: hypothetical protein VI895_15085 [Bdellovibrionota bacterium]|nr:hypothetical protein [Bdellovibrionota bacterium]